MGYSAWGWVMQTCGAWWHRRMFWQAGVFGQILCLAAETAGVRGAGCCFDGLIRTKCPTICGTWRMSVSGCSTESEARTLKMTDLG
jgi:hypothetical protein